MVYSNKFINDSLTCPDCGSAMTPVWYIEEEEDSNHINTGRKRLAVDYLFCPYCMYKEIVDSDFMADEWR